MRLSGTARLAVLSVAAGSLALAGGPAAAASVVTPSRVGNDAVKTFSVPGTYYATSQEAVALHARPANGQADVPGTVTGTGTCSGLTLTGVSNSSCAGPLVFTADSTNVVPGTYDVVETKTDMSTLPSTTSAATLGQVSVFAQPRFGSSNPVAPATRGQNSSSTITIKGTGFAPGTTAAFGAGTTVANLVVASPTQLTVDVTVAPGAVTGVRDVVLTSPDEVTAGTKASDTLHAGFTVTDAPALTSATPASGVATVTQKVTFKGSHLTGGADFVLNIPQVTVANVAVVDATTVTADVTPNRGAKAGPRSVFVINPDGGRSSLVGGFTVIAPPDAPASVRTQAGDSAVFLVWTAPADTGSGPVTGYRVTTTGGSVQPVEVSGTAAYLGGLANGTAYSFTVAAKNAQAGYGVESAVVTATPKVGVTLTAGARPATVPAGQRVALSGRLTTSSGGTALSGATVTVRYAPQVGSPFTHTVTTAADGTWQDGFTGVYNTSVTASYAGTADVQARTSVPVAVKVAPRVTVSSPRSGASSTAGSWLSVSGGVTPNKAGRTARLVRLVGGRQQLLARATIARNGTYRFSLRLPRGTSVLAVTLGGTPGNVGGSSPRFTVRRT